MTLTSDDIIGTIDLSKENEGLYFLLLKKNYNLIYD